MNRTLRELREIPDLAALIPNLITTHTSHPAATTGFGPRPPARLDIIDLTTSRPAHRIPNPDDLTTDHLSPLDLLASWVICAEAWMLDLGLNPVPTPDTTTITIAQACGWLITHHDDTTAAPWYHLLTDDIHRTHRTLTRTLGDRPTYRPRCPHCHTKLTAHDTNAWWSCPACGHTWITDHELTRLATQQQLTIPEAARAAHISERRLRRHVTATGLQPTGHRGPNPTYPADTLTTLATSLATA